MDLKRISSASTIAAWAVAGAALAALCGCSTLTLSNLTSSSLPENPSEIYTFTLRVTPKSGSVVADSIQAHIVLDGQSHDMKADPAIANVFEYDFQVPTGQTEITYYYLVDYKVQGNDLTSSRQAYTDLAHAAIVRRYVLSLEVNRGPVGARVGVLGRGFTPQDVVCFENSPVRTVFESPTSLGFFVPALAPGATYRVSISGATGNSPVGTFRIDPSNVTVQPASLTLASGERQPLTFSVANPAPAGGLLLDVTTDVPESVIMPEVVIAEGQTSATITVEGGKPGTGSLFLKGYGNGEVTVPVTVAAIATAQAVATPPGPASPPAAK